MYSKYRDRAAFLFVYIQEAHPDDGWKLDSNAKDEVVVSKPTSWTERKSVAGSCCASLDLTMPCVVDTMDNEVDELYAGWPERIYIVDAQGNIAYTGGIGPFGFDPAQAERRLKRLLAK